MYCYICKQKKEIGEFFRDKSKKTGYSNRCKPCDVLKRKRFRFLHLEETRITHYKYIKTTNGKQRINEASKRAYIKHKSKWITRFKLREAVKKGLIDKLPCYCGELKSEGHHKDYNQPLIVTWLCPKHHAELHANLEYLTKYYLGI